MFLLQLLLLLVQRYTEQTLFSDKENATGLIVDNISIIYNQFHNILRLFGVLPKSLITYKHDIHELLYELPNEFRLRILEIRKYQKTVLTSQNDSLVPSLPAKMKVLSILEENSWKTEIKLFPLCAISYENYSQSQIFCESLQMRPYKRFIDCYQRRSW